jgi:hypothetical protein
MGRVRVEHHLEALSEVFDAAKVVIRTPFPFASDITDAARPIAISGSRELIERSLHRGPCSGGEQVRALLPRPDVTVVSRAGVARSGDPCEPTMRG